MAGYFGAYFGGGGSSADTTAPTITAISPTPGTKFASRRTPLELTVEDADPGLRLVVLSLRYVTVPGTWVVHNGTGFVYPFDSADSERIATGAGWTYSIVPRGGWAGDISQLWVYAVDQDGNMEGTLPP